MNDANYVPSSPRLSQGDIVRAGSNFVLRFENDDRRDWHLACPPLGLEACRLAAAETTPVLVRCPDEAGDLSIVNQDRRSEVLRRRLARPDAPDAPAVAGA